jgi:hypothetical protein
MTYWKNFKYVPIKLLISCLRVIVHPRGDYMAGYEERRSTPEEKEKHYQSVVADGGRSLFASTRFDVDANGQVRVRPIPLA